MYTDETENKDLNLISVCMYKSNRYIGIGNQIRYSVEDLLILISEKSGEGGTIGSFRANITF